MSCAAVVSGALKINNQMVYMYYEPAHDKTYNMTCMTSKDRSALSPSIMARFLVYPSLDSLEAVEGTCYQQRLWSDCVDVQADLSFHKSHKSYCWLCRVLALI